MRQSRPAFLVVWHGAALGTVAPWSRTKGEILPPRRQTERPFGDERDDNRDQFGLYLDSLRAIDGRSTA